MRAMNKPEGSVSKSMVKRLEVQLADEPKEKLIAIIAEQQSKLNASVDYAAKLGHAERELAFWKQQAESAQSRLHTLHSMLLERIDSLAKLDPVPDSAEGVRLLTLAELCEAYEKRRYDAADNGCDKRDALQARLGAVASLCEQATRYHGAVAFADAIRSILVERQKPE